MIPTASPATFTQNFGVPFADENSMYERLRESSDFSSDTTAAYIAYIKRIINYINPLEIREEDNFIPFSSAENTTSTSKKSVMPNCTFHTFYTPATDDSALRIAHIRALLSAPPLIDPSSFENIQNFLENLGFRKCAERIKYLRSDDAIEDGDEPFSLASAQGFVKLMEDFQDLGEPLLGLFSQGTLGVEWRVANDKHLLVEPFDSESACFALIGPSTEREKRFRLNGRGSITDVIKTLRKEGVDQWQNI